MATKRIQIPTADTTASKAQHPRSINPAWLLHAGFVLWITTLLTAAHVAPLQYNALVQEDRFIEWWTVTLFVAAAWTRIAHAWPRRRIVDLLVGAFCVFVAGEEMSWGQRLLGFTPPATFLEYNTQQEFTLHNFADIFGQPKFTLMAVLFAFGILLPLFARLSWGRRLLDRLGATPPPLSLSFWFATAIALLLTYPVEFTGEWIEALAGALFFVTARPSPRALRVGGLASIVAALGLSAYSARSGADDTASVACARTEAGALVRDLASGSAATPRLFEHGGSIHKRLFSAERDGYIEANELRAFAAVHCGKSVRYALDPWGMPYWLRVSRVSGGSRSISVYSMGPNRRRDESGDDVTVTAIREH